jgi:hypothetical protein
MQDVMLELRNKSWKPECVGSFNMDLRILVFYPEPEASRLAAAGDKAYQLLAHVRWFYPGTPASSTTKTGRHDIAEIMLKVAWKTEKLPENLYRSNSRKFYKTHWTDRLFQEIYYYLI